MKLKQSLLFVTALACGSLAQAAVTAEEAKALGTTLTPLGATMAGNKDGTIPAYTGGMTTPPAGFKPGDGIRPDPYADEKPRFSITAANLAEYADHLTEGARELLKRHPSYRIDVFPTHRSAAFPDSVIENTVKNATRAKTSEGGRAIEGASGGIPFPIPKDGFEVMWNHLLHYKGLAYRLSNKSWNVNSSGDPIMSTSSVLHEDYPYYGPDGGADGVYWRILVDYTGPARRVGEKLIAIDSVNALERPRRAWQYLPGQRRVKLAPDVSYDTPNPGSSGNNTYDDVFVFNGAMDRFDFKLIGKKEVIVPYNAYRLVYEGKSKTALMPKHMNPDVERWELHRVWVVEGTLRDGYRHVYSKRVFYIDEDTWTALASDQYDAHGQLYRSQFDYLTPSYDVKAIFTNTWVTYDFVAGVYSLGQLPSEDGGVTYATTLWPKRGWAPDSLAGAGIR